MPRYRNVNYNKPEAAGDNRAVNGAAPKQKGHMEAGEFTKKLGKILTRFAMRHYDDLYNSMKLTIMKFGSLLVFYQGGVRITIVVNNEGVTFKADTPLRMKETVMIYYTWLDTDDHAELLDRFEQDLYALYNMLVELPSKGVRSNFAWPFDAIR